MTVKSSNSNRIYKTYKINTTTKYLILIYIFKMLTKVSAFCVLKHPFAFALSFTGWQFSMVDIITRWSPWRDCIGNMPTTALTYTLQRIDLVSTDSWRWECPRNSCWLRPCPNWRAFRRVISGLLMGLN